MWSERVETDSLPVRATPGGGKVLGFARPGTDPAAARLIGLVAASRDIPLYLLLQEGRGEARVAEARQLAMYLMHVAEGRLYAEIGRVFGRDRTTVSHACAVIEERRECAAFDEAVDRLEQALGGGAP